MVVGGGRRDLIRLEITNEHPFDDQLSRKFALPVLHTQGSC